jgi:hypothetical protein
MLRIKNTSTDRSKALLHRKAPKLEMEPMVNGRRLFMGQSCDLPEEVYEKNEDYYNRHIANGVLEIVGQHNAPKVDRMPPLDANGLKLDGPTLEEWVKAGYMPENYPPKGWAEKPSVGLAKFRADQADAAIKKEAAAKAKAHAESEAALAVALSTTPKPVVDEAPKATFDEVVTPTEALTTSTEPAGASVDTGSVQDPTQDSTQEQIEQKRGPGRPKKKLF